MKREGYEVLLMTETNVNSSCVETWDGYTAFYSTNIDPKVKEQEPNNRENAAISERRQCNPGHAGVGIIVKDSLVNSVTHVRQRNGRTISITFFMSSV